MLSPDRPNSRGTDLKYFVGPLIAKKQTKQKTKTKQNKFPKVTDYFNVKIYFSNTLLNSMVKFLKKQYMCVIKFSQ